MALLVLRRRGDGHEQVEQRPQIGPRLGEVRRCRSSLRICVHDREVDLELIGAEVHEQLVDVVEDLCRPRVGSVDLVERHDHRQVALHRLLEHVARLRQRSLGGVDQQQDGVDHQQRALDLAAEVRVAGRVDDVEADAVVVDRRLLGEDGDPLLALEVAGVEHAVDHRLVGAEGPGLAQHAVDQGRLAVVDVGDDRHVAQVGADGGGHGASIVAERLDGVLIARSRSGTCRLIGTMPTDALRELATALERRTAAAPSADRAERAERLHRHVIDYLAPAGAERRRAAGGRDPGLHGQRKVEPVQRPCRPRREPVGRPAADHAPPDGHRPPRRWRRGAAARHGVPRRGRPRHRSRRSARPRGGGRAGLRQRRAVEPGARGRAARGGRPRHLRHHRHPLRRPGAVDDPRPRPPARRASAGRAEPAPARDR